MNRHKRFSVWVAMLLAGCVLPLDIQIGDDHQDSTSLRGSGHAVTVSREVRAYHRIQVAGLGRVILERTGREHLSITGDDNLVAYLESEVRGGTLYIQPKRGLGLDPETPIVFRIEAVRLDHIEGSGAVEFEVDLGSQPTLAVMLSGVCSLEASGAVDHLEVSLSGVTGYRGLDLESRTARVSVSGASGADVRVTQRLDADASGTSWIRYAGNPREVIAHTSGLASVTRY